VWVRGALGPMTCWVTRNDVEDVMEEPSEWTRVYEAEHSASPAVLTELKLAESIRLLRGERCGLYVHSGLRGDEGLVYDNQRGDVTYHDKVLKVLPGLAHISNRPFGTRGMWWGSAWRRNRAFVGRLAYGVRWRRWSPAPEVHHAFPRGFRETVITLLAGSRRPESLLYLLQDEVIFFLMNKCSYNWWGEEMHGGARAEEEWDGDEWVIHCHPTPVGEWDSEWDDDSDIDASDTPMGTPGGGRGHLPHSGGSASGSSTGSTGRSISFEGSPESGVARLRLAKSAAIGSVTGGSCAQDTPSWQ